MRSPWRDVVPHRVSLGVVCRSLYDVVEQGAKQGISVRLPLYIRLLVAVKDVWLACKDSTLRFYVLYVTFTWLGNFVSPFCFCFHLLDIVNRSPTLQAVLQAVTHNGRQLVMTFVLMVRCHSCAFL